MAGMKHNSKRRAAATVEMALILPLLMILTLGLIEYGWLFLNAHRVTNAARQGARVGARPDSTNADVLTTVDTIMQQADLGSSGYQVAVTPSDITTLQPGEQLTVEVSLPYANIELVGTTLLPVPSTLRSSLTMAREGP
ncbi:MAG TPA: hypothetical protein DCX07_10600 [Phycisphaerales bacterium]|nr:hypothetical protein [Phycisphaerales bacterium]